MVGTTTDESKLRDAFLSRFDTVIELREYSPENLSEIVRFASDRAGLALTEDAEEVIAERARSTQRDVGKIVRKLRDLAVINGGDDGQLDRQLAVSAADHLGYGPHGLRPREVEMMSYIHDHGPVGARTLSRALRFGTVENCENAEDYLVERRWIVPSPRGRVLSDEGQCVLAEIHRAS